MLAVYTVDLLNAANEATWSSEVFDQLDATDTVWANHCRSQSIVITQNMAAGSSGTNLALEAHVNALDARRSHGRQQRCDWQPLHDILGDGRSNWNTPIERRWTKYGDKLTIRSHSNAPDRRGRAGRGGGSTDLGRLESHVNAIDSRVSDNSAAATLGTSKLLRRMSIQRRRRGK